eukprot:CAMPEP_0174837794 /NCGR_PEP_ID=MMETSP1114-20130205/6990_1 /TAXON_ID=312471 /ORGANISM="Neobodo designis, Strain CCAP 1951/1" /LENGTH=118 /DNA_ID=CAMNT_0016071875 /DNA_START=40 /DNA_END=393 /DNA_ORIENTATION=-
MPSTPRDDIAVSDDAVQVLVSSTLQASHAAFPVTEAATEAIDSAHADLERGIEVAKREAASVDDKMAQCAESFGKLPHYTEKLKSMAANMKILRENVAKLRSMTVDIGRDAKEYCAAA